MEKKVKAGKYSLTVGMTLVSFTVSENNRCDLPIPHIYMSIQHPSNLIPKHGFYLKGIFKRDKSSRDIIQSEITRIVFLTEDMREHTVLQFF